MSENNPDKQKILDRLGDLSKLLGMIPDDAAVSVTDPVTHNSTQISQWFDEARKSFFDLSILLNKELGLNLPWKIAPGNVVQIDFLKKVQAILLYSRKIC